MEQLSKIRWRSTALVHNINSVFFVCFKQHKDIKYKKAGQEKKEHGTWYTRVHGGQFSFRDVVPVNDFKLNKSVAWEDVETEEQRSRTCSHALLSPSTKVVLRSSMLCNLDYAIWSKSSLLDTLGERPFPPLIYSWHARRMPKKCRSNLAFNCVNDAMAFSMSRCLKQRVRVRGCPAGATAENRRWWEI